LTKVLNNIIELFYRRRWMCFLLIGLILAGGVWAHYTLETEAYPEFSNPTVRIITLAPGKGAEEVERLITVPLEKELNAIPGESWMRSISILGLSVISIVFDDNTVQMQNRQQVLERIAQADLPDGVQPGLDPDSGGIGEIYRYTLESKYYSPMSRRAIEDWQLERAFKQIPGVIDVSSFGGPTKNYQVNIDPKKLVSYGVTVSQVFQAIQNSNSTTGGNYIENNGRAYVVRGLGLLRGTKDIEDVVVSSTQDGTPIRIKDIAEVDIGPGLRLGQLGKNEDDDALEGIVLMKRGENASVVVNRLYEKLPEIKAALPAGVHLEKLYDRQELVDHTLETVFHNVFEGVILVVVVLIVFLFDITSGLIASVAIPLSLCLALALLRLFHIPANLLSLGAIDFGIIVDGAVVMVENVFARLCEQTTELSVEEKKELILDCAKQVGPPILFAILVIMTCFLPIFAFEGVAGKLFRPLCFTMNFNLLGALISALFVIPTLLGIFLTRRKLAHRESPVIHFANKVYRPLLFWSLNHAKIVVLGAVACLVATIIMASNIGFEFLPALDEGNIWLRVTVLPTSVSLEESVKIAHRIRQIIKEFPEVRAVTSQTGCPDDGTDPNLFSNIEVFLDLKPAKDWRPEFHGEKKELIAELNKKLAVVPNVLLYFSQYIQDNVDESIAGAKGTLAVKVFGPDLKELQKLGDQIAAVASTVPGMCDIATNQQLGQPQYQVEIDRDKASRYGVNVSDIQTLVETAIGGKVATKLIDGEKRFPVFVRLQKEYRDTERALDNVLIDPPGPISSVPLTEMATIKYADGAAFITREKNARVMYVRINIRGRDLGSAVQEAQAKIAKRVRIPEGYTVQWAGQYEFAQQANQRLMLVVPFTMALIYLILWAAFRTHKHAGLIMAAVPLAAFGGVAALLITGTYFSISAGVGFIALSGVAVQNGVILISYIKQLRAEGYSVRDAAYAGAVNRMRPVLMTATVATLGLVPAATSNGIGAQSQRPFAIVIIGGLMSATVLTLVVLPALYTLVNRSKDRSMPQSNPVMVHGIWPIIGCLLLAGTLSGCSSHALSLNAVPGSASMPKPLSATNTGGPGSQTPPAVNTGQVKTNENGLAEVTLTDAQKSEIGLDETPVKHGYVYNTIESPGQVQPNSELSAQVSTPSAGRAVTVKVKLGDNVQPGEVMAVIKSDPIGQVQSDLLQNTLQARADIKQQEVQLKLSHITYDREKKLWAEQVSAQADLQTAENQLEKDEANLAALKSKMDSYLTVAQERLTLLGAPPDSAKKVLAQTKIDPWVIVRAPREGLVIERDINPGELNDGSKPLFILADLSEVWLVANIFEKDVEQVKKGDEAVVSLDSLPGHPFPAKIVFIGDSINATTRTLPVRANVANPQRILKPGMFARIKVSAGQVPVMLVPRSAIVQMGDKTIVFVDEGNGKFTERDIETGVDDVKGIEVKRGLKLGEKVVYKGATALLGTVMRVAESPKDDE
jgi:cobalt-zinc-cadmium resistance protein CzcA